MDGIRAVDVHGVVTDEQSLREQGALTAEEALHLWRLRLLVMHEQTVHVVHIVVQFVHAILVHLLDDVGLLLSGVTEVVHTAVCFRIRVISWQYRLVVTGEGGLWNKWERLSDRLLFDSQLLVLFLLLLDDLLNVLMACSGKGLG